METATADIDTDKLSTDLAADLGASMGIEHPESDAALDAAVDTAAETGAEPAKAAEDASGASKGAVRGADGKFTKAAPAAAPDVGPAAAAADDLPVPQSWKKEMHPIWDKLAKGVPLTADEAKQTAKYYNEREKQMLDGLGAYKTDADYGKSVRAVISKHEDILRQQGIDAPRAVEYLFNAHRQLSTGTPEQRMAYLHKVAETYGLKIGAAAAADPNAAPPAALPAEVQAALKRLDAIEGTLTADQQKRYEEHKSAIANDVASFAEAKDEKGVAKHPYFDECADHICLLLKGDPSMQLEAAYETAVWANPTTRQKELARISQETEKANREKAAAAAKAARKSTSTNVTGRDTARAPTAPAASLANLEDVMRETQEEIRSRAE